MPSLKQTALAKARQRRVELDRDRAARDSRVEQCAARVFVLLEQQAAAERAKQQANAGIGQALRELLTDGVTVDGAAELCELDLADVRRLLRTAGPAVTPGGPEPNHPQPSESGSGTVTQLQPAVPAPAGELSAATGVATSGEKEVAGAARRAQ